VISLAYYSARKSYIVERELPAGKGFADLIFLPRKNNSNPAMIVELKYNKSAEGAIEQIKKKQYADSLKDYSGEILLVGINYNKDTKKHDCVIEKIVK
jgi:RecB family endonuclease NucS